MEPITVKSSIDLKTLYKVTLGTVFNLKVLLVVIALLLILIVPAFLDGKFDLSENWVGVVLLLIFVVVFPVVLWVMCNKYMKTNPFLYEAGTCIIDNHTIAYQTQSTSTSSNWQLIKKGKDTNTHYLLFTSFNAFLFLSKDGFSSAGDVARFKEIVKANNIKNNFK